MTKEQIKNAKRRIGTAVDEARSKAIRDTFSMKCHTVKVNFENRFGQQTPEIKPILSPYLNHTCSSCTNCDHLVSFSISHKDKTTGCVYCLPDNDYSKNPEFFGISSFK